ncbi:MAG: S8 family serine peptidase [Actinomycetes bacterium]
MALYGISPGFTPSQVKTAYGFPTTAAPVKQNIALVALDSAIMEDALTATAQCYQIPVQDQPKFVSIDLGTRMGSDAEATGDAQTLMVLGAGVLDTVYVVSGQDATSSPVANYLDVLSRATTLNDNEGKPVDIVSASYAACETQFDANFGSTVAMSEEVLAKAAIAGRTVVAATGDAGSSACAPNGMGDPAVAVNYPASSAYVTAVGGTNLLLDAKNAISNAQVWNDSYLMMGTPSNPGGNAQLSTGGGGGVSTVVPAPSWQNHEGIPAQKYRQVPDVSYLAADYPGMATPDTLSGDPSTQTAATFFGTSMATPLFAVAIANYNARHSAAHIGFLNQKLYKAIESKTVTTFDVTQGSNVVAQLDPQAQPYFPKLACCTAATGYDNASGWGSVNVQSIIDKL